MGKQLYEWCSSCCSTCEARNRKHDVSENMQPAHSFPAYGTRSQQQNFKHVCFSEITFLWPFSINPHYSGLYELRSLYFSSHSNIKRVHLINVLPALQHVQLLLLREENQREEKGDSNEKMKERRGRRKDREEKVCLPACECVDTHVCY